MEHKKGINNCTYGNTQQNGLNNVLSLKKKNENPRNN